MDEMFALADALSPSRIVHIYQPGIGLKAVVWEHAAWRARRRKGLPRRSPRRGKAWARRDDPASIRVAAPLFPRCRARDGLVTGGPGRPVRAGSGVPYMTKAESTMRHTRIARCCVVTTLAALPLTAGAVPGWAARLPVVCLCINATGAEIEAHIPSMGLLVAYAPSAATTEVVCGG
jgi:hypothetical protein